jgi:peptide/nickel transport system substrate-binding protein
VGQPAASSPREVKRISAAIMGDPHTLSSTMNIGSGLGSVRGVDELERVIHGGLATTDHTGRLVAHLAEAVPTVENGLWKVFPDGRMETTWRIKEGARWHDGTPLGAEDLAFTVAVGRDRDLPVLGHAAYDLIEAVEVVDPRTVVVRWLRPYIEADAVFAKTPSRIAIPLPRHLLERGFSDDKAAFTQLPYWTTEFVGIGAYQLREWVSGSHLLVEASDRYVLGRPKIDEILVKFLLDPNTVIANVLAGTVELTIGRSASVDQAVSFREQWKDGKVEVALEESPMSLLVQHLNPQPALVGDVRFRRALVHATDRQQLVDALVYGLVPVAHMSIAPNQPEYRDVESSVHRYDYDPRRAAEQLEALGLVRASDGLYRDGAGQRLSVELRTLDGDDLRNKALLAIADHWQRAGVGADPVIMPRQRQREMEYRATFPGFEMVRASGNDFRDLRTMYVPLPENGYAGRNRGRYANPELDSLIERYFFTIPRNERMEVLRRIVGHTSEQVVTIDLFYNTLPIMVGNRLDRVTAEAIGWNAHEWDTR